MRVTNLILAVLIAGKATLLPAPQIASEQRVPTEAQAGGMEGSLDSGSYGRSAASDWTCAGVNGEICCGSQCCGYVRVICLCPLGLYATFIVCGDSGWI